jgi:hypothetical protein
VVNLLSSACLDSAGAQDLPLLLSGIVTAQQTLNRSVETLAPRQRAPPRG